MTGRHLLLLAFGLLPPFCGAAQGQERWTAPAWADTLHNPFGADNAAAVAAGHELYSLWCMTCHGENGDGAGSAGQAWDPGPADFTSGRVQQQSDGALFWKMTTGNPPHMLSYKRVLSEKERWQLVSYLRQFAGPGEQ